MDREEETKVEQAKTDVDLLEAGTSVGAASSNSEKNRSNQVVWVNPKTGNYEGEPISWSFRKVGDRSAFRAKLKDESFLNQLKIGDIRLSGKDALKVELVEVQNLEEGTISREITKVLEYKPAPVQIHGF